jgi:predicted porin
MPDTPAIAETIKGFETGVLRPHGSGWHTARDHRFAERGAHPFQTLERGSWMNKKLLAATVAGAFSAPAATLAQSSFVQIYGTFNVDLQYVSSDDPTPIPPAGINGAVFRGTTRPLGTAPANNNIPGQMAVSSNSSNIGFRGSEDLGNGWKAIFQLESALNIDSGGGNLGGRNSNVGLTGNWGTAFYGLWDTPFKTMWGRNYAFFGTSAASFIGLFGSPGYNILGGTQTTPTLLANANTSDAAAFDRRQTNTVAYRTPNFAGLSAGVHYVHGEQKSSVTPLRLCGAAVPQPLDVVDRRDLRQGANLCRGRLRAAQGLFRHSRIHGRHRCHRNGFG